MITANAEETQSSQASSEQPKATKKARAGAQRAHVAPAKAKSGKKATPAKKTAPAPKKAAKASKTAKAKGTREGWEM